MSARTGTADMRWGGAAAGRVGWHQVQVASRVMRADVDVAPSSTESPTTQAGRQAPTHPHPILSLPNPDTGRQFACQRRHRPPIIKPLIIHANDVRGWLITSTSIRLFPPPHSERACVSTSVPRYTAATARRGADAWTTARGVCPLAWSRLLLGRCGANALLYRCPGGTRTSGAARMR